MKNLQKLILPILLLAAIVLIYTVYFSPSDDLGSFSDFDVNNSAVKDIKVQVIPDRGINTNSHGGATFYVADKSGKVYVVNAEKVSADLESAKVVILRGHLNKDSFHAHDVLLD